MKKQISSFTQGMLLIAFTLVLTGCDEFFSMMDNPVTPRLNVRSNSITLKVGATASCEASTQDHVALFYASADPAVATVDAKGTITGVAVGKTKITVTAKGEDEYYRTQIFGESTQVIDVEVIPAKVDVKGIKLSETTLDKKVGDADVTLTVTFDPAEPTDKTVTWESSNTSVATVDENGKVTFVGGGTATITATATNGTADTSDDKTATCAVTVALPPIPYKTYTWDGSTLSGPTDASATEYTKVTSSTVTWSDGTYVVDDNVTISGNIKVSGNVNLILCDGKKLTVGSIEGSSYGVGILSIYTQSVGTTAGSFVATNNFGNAIYALNTLKIYGGDIQAKSSSSSCGGIVNTQIDVYGGKLTTKNTSSDGYGIYIGSGDIKSINLYGGELRAEGQGAINGYDYGIVLKHDSSCLTVYPGAKLYASNTTGDASHYAIKGKIKSGTSAVKFYFGDNSTWDSGTSYDSPTDCPGHKFVKAGY